MIKVVTAALLVCVSVAGALPADARVCRNSHGKRFPCHKVVAPRVNLKEKHPVKVERCRGQVGKYNNC